MSENLLIKGLEHGFIDFTVPAEDGHIPKFITNSPARGEKVITSLKSRMMDCDEFMFSVAFITYDGINILLNEFKTLKERGVKGRILASQYRNFTDPKALKKLSSFDNIELRIITEEQMNMHSKCYIFSKNGDYDVIIGSSNLTNNALCSNGEWNLLFNSSSSGEVVNEIINEFNRMFEYATSVTDIWIEEYSLIYDELRDFRLSHQSGVPYHANEEKRIEPNTMQVEALKQLQELRDRGERRALVISATGSGKTYLSAFDARVAGGKYLYLVHRRQILSKSMESFKKVLGPSRKIELYEPGINLSNVDCLFSTTQTMGRESNFKTIPRDFFDYILIDEVHHAGAEGYQRIINYFEPKFLVGMTATPDRADGYDIYSLFDHNIAYEIRLKQAMDLKLICPFHYFGITDLSIDGIDYDNISDFSKLEIDRRVEHIIENMEFYGYSGDRVKGIVFCRRRYAGEKTSEAEVLATLFARRGYRTSWLDGSMDREYIESEIERLESEECQYALDYIFVTDLFNEGVDIPSVNQVVMLRRTESPIVYIQQLGRGLRLHRGKDFLVVLDFIGNYDNNYNIPLALSDDHSYNKSEVRRFVATGDNILSGNSTISFDEVSKARIYESIDNTDFTEEKLLTAAYKDLRDKLGRIPKLTDFRMHGTIDALNIVSKHKSYHNFLCKKEKEYDITFNEQESKMLEYLSKIIAPGKRCLEIQVLEGLCDGFEDFRELLSIINPKMSKNAVNNITAVFSGEFYKNSPALVENGIVGNDFLKMISNPEFMDAISDLIALGKENNELFYSDLYDDTNFVLNGMYTYADVSRLMNWPADVDRKQNIGGYKFDYDTKTFSVFINYVKGDDVVESQRYEDHFESRNSLVALSKSTEKKNAKNMIRVRDHISNGMDIHLFVRKNKKDKGSKEFYYLGKMDFVTFMNDEKPVKIRYRLRNEVRVDLYDYFNS